MLLFNAIGGTSKIVEMPKELSKGFIPFMVHETVGPPLTAVPASLKINPLFVLNITGGMYPDPENSKSLCLMVISNPNFFLKSSISNAN
ncbi:MAG: hypothetical protein ACD_64C00211G0001 [uncultured bacterium]|nr:MAG: hypothetical protein ACD_64C00211G0001 [uncultured bacterium]